VISGDFSLQSRSEKIEIDQDNLRTRTDIGSRASHEH